MLRESPKFYLSSSKTGVNFKDFIEKKLLDQAEKTPSVIVGMGGQVIFADNRDSIRVRVIASDKTRIQRIRKKYGLGESEAEKSLQQSDKRHKKYISTLYNIDWADPLYFDLVLNTDYLTVDQCVELIAFQADMKNNGKLFGNIGSDKEDADKGFDKALFKHPAEEEFANILDMYGIKWEYEPRTFPVQWDAEGNVTMAFKPDFYLTKYDTYIEITTMEQKYVTTKNKKVKRLRELYPGININIVYKKDFHSLLERFGFSGGDEIDEFNRS
jgi:cytidylate kinase